MLSHPPLDKEGQGLLIKFTGFGLFSSSSSKNIRCGFMNNDIEPGMGVSSNSKDESNLWRRTSQYTMGH